MAFSIRSSGLAGSLSEKRMYGLGAETPGTLHIGVQGKQGEPGPTGPRGPAGQDGITPTIGDNGNWFIGDFDTGLPSRGNDGKNATEEEIEAAVAKYFEENPPSAGDVSLTGYAKEEWVSKNFQPKGNYLTEHQDISGKLDADKLPEAINTALAQAKASGEFKGDKGDKGDPGQSIKGDKGDPGEPGKTPIAGTDYFTDTDKTEMVAAVLAALAIAEEASF